MINDDEEKEEEKEEEEEVWDWPHPVFSKKPPQNFVGFFMIS